MKLSLETLMGMGVTYDNINKVWVDNGGACYSLKDKNALDQIECEELNGSICEYWAANKVTDD